MRIFKTCIILCCLTALTLCADEHRPKKKDKRNLEYTVSHHYSTPHSYHSLERRISTGPTHPYYPPSQYYPGTSRLHSSPYRKDNPTDQETNHLASAENIERGGHSGGTIYVPHKPLIIEKPIYIRDPEPIIEIIIKDSNVTLPPPPEEPTLPPQKKKKEEVQVFYVKYKKNPYGTGKNSVIYDKPVPAITPVVNDETEEEEPIEQPPPTNQGYGYNGDYNNEVVTELPKPSTTLRTVIKPDSEIYHSPGNNVKVTFGKEGFDYDKRSSKPEDYVPPRPESTQHPQARQLSSFSDAYFRSPVPSFFQSNSNNFKQESRSPQSYRPFNFPPPPLQYNSNSNRQPPNTQFNRPPSSQYSQQPKYPFQSPPYVKPSNSQPPSFSGPPGRPDHPTFSHSISHPPPPQFQSNSRPQFFNSRPPKFQAPTSADNPGQRQPVPYKPFDNFKQQQGQYQQRPSFTQHHARQPQPQFSQQPLGPPREIVDRPTGPAHVFNGPPKQIQFRPETPFASQQLPAFDQNVQFKDPSFSQLNNEYKNILEPHLNGPSAQALHRPKPQAPQNIPFKPSQQLPQQSSTVQFNHQPPLLHQPQQQKQQQYEQQQPQHHQHYQQLPPQQPQQTPEQNAFIQQQNAQQNEHFNNIRTAQNLLPAGGELIQSLPKFEQHLVYDAATGQQAQSLPLQREPSLQFSSQDFAKLQQAENNKQTAQEHRTQDTNNHAFAQQQRNLKQIFAAEPTTQRPFVYSTTQRPFVSSTERSFQYSTTEKSYSTTTSEPEKPSTTTKDPKILEAQLPDEVPEDLREQLLSSGILNNADISILDYDKVGDIPLSALPPDQLANFYSAGGGQQLAAAGSEPVPQVVNPQTNNDPMAEEDPQEAAASEVQEVRVQPNSAGNPEAKAEKRQVQEAYVGDNSKQVDPVVLNDSSYNRYLPLKINGSHFPLPDSPELKGKKITGVVVLAPVSYDFASQEATKGGKEPSDLELIQSEPLKKLMAAPTLDNYKQFLETERSTPAAKQSIIMLVTGSPDLTQKEIFMYDVSARAVSKLNGELSSAFVDAAEANSSDTDSDEAASNIIETRIPFTGDTGKIEARSGSSDEADLDLEDSASNIVETRIPVIDPSNADDLESEASEQLESFVDIAKIQRNSDDLANSDSDESKDVKS